MRLGRKKVLRIRQRRCFFIRKNSVFTVIVLLLTVVFCYLSVTFILRVRPIIISFAQSKARYIAMREIEKSVYDIIAKENVSYESLMEINRNTEGAVTSVSASATEIAAIKSRLTEDINERIDQISETEIFIPLGSITGNELLEGVGPRLKLTAITTGSVYFDVKSEFSEAGINQTRHKVFFDIKVNMKIIIKGKSFSDDVTTTIPVAETLIVGEVPDTYTNITEAQDSTFDIASNLIQ